MALAAVEAEDVEGIGAAVRSLDCEECAAELLDIDTHSLKRVEISGIEDLEVCARLSDCLAALERDQLPEAFVVRPAAPGSALID